MQLILFLITHTPCYIYELPLHSPPFNELMSSFTYNPEEYAGPYPTDQDHVPLVWYSNINQGASFTKPLKLHGYTSSTVFTHPTPTDKQKRQVAVTCPFCPLDKGKKWKFVFPLGIFKTVQEGYYDEASHRSPVNTNKYLDGSAFLTNKEGWDKIKSGGHNFEQHDKKVNPANNYHSILKHFLNIHKSDVDDVTLDQSTLPTVVVNEYLNKKKGCVNLDGYKDADLGIKGVPSENVAKTGEL